MATDTQVETSPAEPIPARPSLRIERIHIRGLKSIHSLDLPGDGLGWKGPIPDVLTVGGANGSGKSTLLEFLAALLDLVSLDRWDSVTTIPEALEATEAEVDFAITLDDGSDWDLRFIIGDRSIFEVVSHQIRFGYAIDDRPGSTRRVRLRHGLGSIPHPVAKWLSNESEGAILTTPGVVHFPSEDRRLISPGTNYKRPGKLTTSDRLVYRWKAPLAWEDSLEAYLYGLRWEDLNAKEEGGLLEEGRYASYSRAFDRYFEGSKSLEWIRGELVVLTRSGDVHHLSQLSSGEKQVILFAGELLHRWRPGSLILIDEPELHLHEILQARLWEMLIEWREERGGQLIFATQSNYFFGLGEPGTKVLVGGRRGQ